MQILEINQMWQGHFFINMPFASNNNKEKFGNFKIFVNYNFLYKIIYSNRKYIQILKGNRKSKVAIMGIYFPEF